MPKKGEKVKTLLREFYIKEMEMLITRCGDGSIVLTI